MTFRVIVTIIGIPAATVAAGIVIGRLVHPRPPQRPWDWPEDEHPSLGGWADREQL